MKKILYSVFALAMAAFTFTACEDVPEPYQIPSEAGGGSSTVSEPAGDGSLENPFNVAGVIDYIQNSENIDDKVYIKGIISQIKEIDPSYGNGTFYISDDGTTNNQFYIYRCYSLNNAKFTSTDEVKVGDEVIIYGNVMIYGGTYETSQNQAYIYSLNGVTSDAGGGEAGEAIGDGTLDNPYNSVAANEKASALSSTEQSDYVYIKGKVVSIKENYDSGFGNATFYISDDGTSAGQFLVYRALYLNNVKYTSGDVLQEGDDVVVYAKLMNYMGNTPETVQNEGYLYSLKGNGGNGGSGETPTPGEAAGTGTQADPYNCVAANSVASALASGAQTDDYVYVKGKVASIKENYDSGFGNATFYISDDGTSTGQFLVYRALYLNNEKYTSGDVLQVGDDVVIYAKLTNYMGNTPETVQGEGYLYSLTSNGGSGSGNEGGSGSGGEVSGNSVVFTPSSLELGNGTAVDKVTLADGTVITFDKGTNNNAPKYYDAGTNIRMYPTNTMTITATKKIASVVINCDVVSGVTCNAGGEVSASPGTVNCDGEVITVSGVNATSTTITNTCGTTGTASQIRMVSMTISYVE